MKALTNILTHLLMLLMIFIMACTEEAAEVDNLTRGEQYVTVRMNIPGMTATATRAVDDGAITSITALAFGSDGNLLDTSGATEIKATGDNGTFTLSVPNVTKTIHFLANLPNNVNIPQSGSQTDVLRGLTTTDTSNLIYWGVAEYTGSSLFVDLYRNMAMIAIAPAVVDTEFNQFTQGQLSIAGLYNANQSGTLVPYKEAFNFDLNENDYYTLPEPLDKSNEKYNEPYSASTYVFEHENTRREPLCAICEIGKSFYKVALVDDRTGEPYDIIRNHKYIIYVSDVDDYQTSTYQADSYENALGKEPINLDVDEVKMVSFIYNEDASLNLNDNETFSVTVNVPEVKGGSLTAIYIETNDFDVTAESGDLTDPVEGVYTYTASMNSETTLTFKPKSAGSKSIVITGEAVNMEVPRKEISVAVNATIVATSTPENPTLYYDSEDPQTVTVDVTIPKGVTALDIDAADFTTIEKTAGDGTLDGTTYTPTNTNGQKATFVFTLNKAKFTNTDTSTITFSDDDESKKQYVTSGEVSVNIEKQTVSEMSVTKSVTIDTDKGQTSVKLTLTKPTNLQNVVFNITDANGTSVNDLFTISVSGNNTQYHGGNTVNDYGNNGTIGVTLQVNNRNTITAGNYTVTFADQNQTMSATATITVVKTIYTYKDKTLYLKDKDGKANPTSLDVTVTVPDGSTLTQLCITATGFIIKQGEETLSVNGSYTYNTYTTGTSTTFTFTPTVIGDHTILFSGEGDNLAGAYKEIAVTVAEQAPKEIVIWGDGDGEGNLEFNWPGDTPYNVEEILNYIGGTLNIDITAKNSNAELQLYNVPGNNYLYYKDFTSDENRIFEFTITESSPTEIKINGTQFTLNKIYIVPPQ